MDDDALLASVMRKLLASDGYMNWCPYVPGYSEHPWVTIDVHQVEITEEELAALNAEVNE